ncbi:transposase [Iningainema tapete]|uniref:Transposase n=1 Tax=Iningainema tapete BLCC-T55 TaxID=2748662 RepID=A0A8J6XEC8_9CYAN|nr:transposase [Iningainema tapete]MBD2770997.1 transposase [Iningainema tapete BLCC-T55]
MSEVNANYDQPCKEALGEYFPLFLEFFFPQVYTLIDWSKNPQSLDKELQQITPVSEAGLCVADKLFQVWLPDGQETWILIHVEVQSQEQKNFAKRMYIYNYRAFDLYETPVISLAVLGDEQASWRPSSYGYSYGGCELSLKFPIAKLLDYQTQWENLEQSTNPFATLTMAHLKTKATTAKLQEREQWKWRLVRGLYERGYNRLEITKLFQLIDQMMTLPKELQTRFEEKLNHYEEERRMPLLSNMELRGMEKIGRESVITVLRVRLGEVPPELMEALNNVSDLSLLKQLLEQAVTVNSLTEFQQLLETENN